MIDKTLTLHFRELPDGKVKATVYEGTNRYLFAVYDRSIALALVAVADKYAAWTILKQVNDNLDRRGQ